MPVDATATPREMSLLLKDLAMARSSVCALLLVLLLQITGMSAASAYSLEARSFERWVVLAAKDNLDDAAAQAREFARQFEGVRVIRTENGWFAICVGPIPAQTITEARQWFGARSSLPGDAYLAKGSKLVEIVYRPGASGSPVASSAPVSPPPPAEPERHTAGTGFFITTKGHMLTNSHVVSGCATVSVSVKTDMPRNGRVLAQDKTNDLAIIATDLTPDAVASMRGNVRLGEQVEAFGFPFSGLLSSGGNFTLGNVTALTGMRDDSRILQISAPVQPGNSGGPLLDEAGRVVGVVVSKLNAIKVALVAEDIPQNINFAIKANVARSFVESQGITIQPAQEDAPAMRSADIADLARSFTGRVECVR
jgi:S1-C subfamily serine protease